MGLLGWSGGLVAADLYVLVYTLVLGMAGFGDDVVGSYRHSSTLSFHTRGNGAVNDVAEGVKLEGLIPLTL